MSVDTESEPKTTQEQFKIEGDKLLGEVQRLVHEGNVRRIIIKQGDRTVVELPLTIGVVGAVLVPMLAAVGAIAALVTECTIVVEKEPESAPPSGRT